MKIFFIIIYILFISIIFTIVSCHNINHNLLKNDSDKNITIYDMHNKRNIVKNSKCNTLELNKNNIIYFNLDKYDILPQFIDILNQHANFLRERKKYSIIIEGYTDEIGTPEYNIALGERRANSIKTYLQSQGVMNDQISIISYGKEKPIALGHSETDHAQNRCTILIY